MKDMKICVLIMSTDSEPSTSNVNAMKKTFIDDAVAMMREHKLNHEYYFVEYMYGSGIEGGSDMSGDGYPYEVKRYDGKENVKRTFEKTVKVLEECEGYDWYVRINISNFLNIRLLDRVIGSFDRRIVYCNAINTIISDANYANNIYPRGDMYIMSDYVRKGVLQYASKYMDDADGSLYNEVPHVDDCLMGLCLMDYFGKDYYDHIRALVYNYLPHSEETMPKVSLNKYAIGSRVKTVPPGVNYSGYSWDDNEYRRCDSKKMELLMKYYQNISYSNESTAGVLRKILAPEEGQGSRPLMVVQYGSASLKDIKAYLKKRRG